MLRPLILVNAIKAIIILYFSNCFLSTSWNNIFWCVDLFYSFVWWFWNTMLSLSITLQNTFSFTFLSENLMSMMFLFDSKHLSKFFLIKKSSHSTSTMVGKYYAFVTFLATNGISHFTTPPHTHQNIMGILNVVIIKLLKRVCIFSLMLPHLSYIGHMHLSLLSISLIACQLQLFTFPLHIQNSLDLNQTTPNFMSLVVCVILGFVHTFHTN